MTGFCVFEVNALNTSEIACPLQSHQLLISTELKIKIPRMHCFFLSNSKEFGLRFLASRALTVIKSSKMERRSCQISSKSRYDIPLMLSYHISAVINSTPVTPS